MSNPKIRELKQSAADLCDHCAQDCRRRLLIIDSQIEALRELLRDFRSLYNQLTLRLVDLGELPLKHTQRTKEPPKSASEEDIKNKLTDWY